MQDTLKTILVATDFSPAAGGAVRRAALIARQHGATLHLLHVVHPLDLYPGQNFDADALDKVALDAAGERLGILARTLAEDYGIPTHAAWRIGRVHTQIAEYAQAVAADLVVAGARGENTRQRLFLGSTTSRLLRVRSGPLLIVRRPNWPYDRVLAAVDFSADSDAALAWARRLAGETCLDVVHVLEPELDRRLSPHAREAANADMRTIAKNLMGNLLANLPGAYTAHVETGYVPVRILDLAEQWRADLIVVGRHGHGGLEAYLLGSVSKDISQAAGCDVLVTGAE